MNTNETDSLKAIRAYADKTVDFIGERAVGEFQNMVSDTKMGDDMIFCLGALVGAKLALSCLPNDNIGSLVLLGELTLEIESLREYITTEMNEDDE